MDKNEIDRQDLMKQLTDVSVEWTDDELMPSPFAFNYFQHEDIFQ